VIRGSQRRENFGAPRDLGHIPTAVGTERDECRIIGLACFAPLFLRLPEPCLLAPGDFCFQQLSERAKIASLTFLQFDENAFYNAGVTS